MKLRMFQVDAFTREPLSGNPAAVCPLDAWLSAERMQAIARENNLSETAFFVPRADGAYHLRWFTPTTEVELCGHATLASAFVIWNCLDGKEPRIEFETQGGRLRVRREGERIALHFPQAWIRPAGDPPAALGAGLGSAPSEVRLAGIGKKPGSYLAVYGTAAEVESLAPDFRTLKTLGEISVNATAPGTDVDFVSRYFAPSFGIDEDPVTGSAHCALTPYWAERLGKSTLHARQVSARGGEIFCEKEADGVVIAGNAVLYMEGTVTL